jgi:hypothetical protein
MLQDLRSAAPWIAVFTLSLIVLIGATKAARHCLLQRGGIQVRLVHRVSAPLWGLSCERTGVISLRPGIF